MLLLCSSQKENTSSYEFKETKLKVYSLEEALYHIYHNWKQTIDDYLSNEFISWVQVILELPLIATQLREISHIKVFSERVIAFLNVIPYFTIYQIKTLQFELKEWENRKESDKLRERADSILYNNSPENAYPLYLQALEYESSPIINHNMGVCLMKLDQFDNATKYLEKAYTADGDNYEFTCNYVEALIRSGSLAKAKSLLEFMEVNDKSLYLWGELYFELGDIKNALSAYEKAYNHLNDFFYLFRIAEIMARLRKFDKALELLKMSRNKNPEYFLKLGEIYVENKNVPAAIKSLEKAIVLYPNNVSLLVDLAMYYRLEYNTDKAYLTIEKALVLDENSQNAVLELAKIQKARGKTKEYQTLLLEILSKFKKDYRLGTQEHS